MSSGEAPLMAAAVTIEGSAARERTEGGDRWMQRAPAESRPCFYRRRWGGRLVRGARFHAGYGGWDAHAQDGVGGGWVLAVARGEGLVRIGCNTRFIKGHKPSNHIRARIKSHVYTTE